MAALVRVCVVKAHSARKEQWFAIGRDWFRGFLAVKVLKSRRCEKLDDGG